MVLMFSAMFFALCLAFFGAAVWSLTVNNSFAKIVLGVVALFFLFKLPKLYDGMNPQPAPMSYSKLKAEAKAKHIEKIDIVRQGSTQVIVAKAKDGKEYTLVAPPDLFMVRDFDEAGVDVSSRVEDDKGGLLMNIFLTFGPILLIAGLFVFMGRQGGKGGGMGPFSFGRSKARILDEANNTTTFNDVAGCDEAKFEVKEIVDFLKEPGKYTKLGGRIPHGLLLVGPPGTGKTLLAKAIAGEAKVPFYSIAGSDFVEMFVGVGASRMRDMFEQARKTSPCIIFIDEIDAVGRQRGGGGMGGGHNSETEQTLNALLVEMDGFGSDQGIIVVAATNRANILDPALLRPGRFDRQVEVGLPDIRGREQILNVHMRKVPLASGVDISSVAKATPGFSGAELANLVNEAALYAARRNGTVITMNDLEEAKDKVYMGVARTSMVMSEDEKRAVAYHESGHAVVGCLLPASDPVYKATIIPRGRALGVVWRLPVADRISYHKNKMLADITVSFAGRIAEDMFLDDISSGASSDYQNATQIAKNMVTQWGMSDVLAPMIYTQEDSQAMMGGSVGSSINMSQTTMQRVDAEIERIVSTQYALAKKLITENVDIMHAMAAGLLQYETLDADQINDLMARKPLQAPKLLNKSEDAQPPAPTLDSSASGSAAALTA
jgi:cell division protease FtsH